MADRRPAWFKAACAMFGVGWGANQFASLLLAYEHHRGLTVSTSEALFGVYALGLVPALLIGGPVSDGRGRRVVVLPAAVFSVVATLILMAGNHQTGLLYAGRGLAGACSGAMFAAATAWVKELSMAPFDPAGHEQTGARRTAVALSAGFGLGPVVAGVIAQWSPSPLVLPYVPHLVVMALVIPGLWTVPETVPTGGVGTVSWRERYRVEDTTRRRFLAVVVPLAPWVFAAPSVGFAVLPGVVASRTRGYGIAFAALAAGVVIALGIAVQPLARRLGRRGLWFGLGAVVTGMLIAAGAARLANWPLVLAADLALGTGYGTCLVSGLIEVQRLARPDDLGALTAVFYALTYVGFAVPVGMAELAPFAGYPAMLLALAGLAALTLVAVAFAATAGRRRNEHRAAPRFGRPS